MNGYYNFIVKEACLWENKTHPTKIYCRGWIKCRKTWSPESMRECLPNCDNIKDKLGKAMAFASLVATLQVRSPAGSPGPISASDLPTINILC